ncbi:MAG: hypothetical protein GXP55_21085 [Deltaproteobacteria bacterium]|nr:hypothetical protein [Deltaproteobacteria bacterium]
MDLETLDRDELERQAARAGVVAPHHKTRRQLIAAIARAGGRSAASRTLDVARTLFGLAASVARSLRPSLSLRPLESADRRATRPLRPAVPVNPSAQRVTVRLKPAPTVEGQKPLPATPSSERVTLELGPRESPKPSATPRSAPDLSEPISTVTMARLLDAQGHHKRAHRIYQELLHSRPEDPALRREMEGARSRAKGRRTQAAKRADDAEAEGEALVALRVDATTALVSWELDDSTLDLSRALLGRDAPLRARALVVFPSEQEFVAREVRTQDADREGYWVLSDLPPDAHTSVAVGLELDTGFYSLAHAVTLPPV